MRPAKKSYIWKLLCKNRANFGKLVNSKAVASALLAALTEVVNYSDSYERMRLARPTGSSPAVALDLLLAIRVELAH